MNDVGKKKLTSQVSISDVAHMAGCAPATVSRRMNNPQMVSDKVKQSIDAAIESLGYVRNGSARALRSSRSRLVGAIVPTLRHSIYAAMLEGLQKTLSNEGFALIHNISNYDLEDEYQQARTLVERGVEAVVLVGTRHKKKTFDLLNSHNVTSVITYALADGFKTTSVGFDNKRASALAANRLYELGHRKFAMLSGITQNNDRATSRLDGFIEALAKKGIPRSDILVREAKYFIEDGIRATDDLLSSNTDFTAIFAGSDILAVGALHACKAKGVRVPEDMSIIGFDNLEIAAFSDPPLSTLNVPAYTMGEESANHIMRNTPENSAARRVELEVSYVERASTASPRGRH